MIAFSACFVANALLSYICQNFRNRSHHLPVAFQKSTHFARINEGGGMVDHEVLHISIPTGNGAYDLELAAGHSTVIIGANGAGKTRLGVYLEQQISQAHVVRIAAHRSLSMADNITAISLERALSGLYSGYSEADTSSWASYRQGHKYSNKPAVALISDFDFLLQALFADQNRTAVTYLENSRRDPSLNPPVTILSRLQHIWTSLLPHRSLTLLELGVRVSVRSSPIYDNTPAVSAPPQPDNSHVAPYSASDMSDGERVMFYLLGQCLLAPKGSIIIIDEPELHIHKAILGRFWDVIEAERPDCAFVYITHDLDFATARPTASKVCIFAYLPTPQWEIETLPDDLELPERIVTELVGSRQSVLFVEGERGSLDVMIYAAAYQHLLIMPIGGCQAVIHTVASFNAHKKLHRFGDVYGAIDADARDDEEISHLNSLRIYPLPVAEIENIFLLPEIFPVVAKTLQFSDAGAKDTYDQLVSEILNIANDDYNRAAVRYASRRLDAEMKRIGLKAKTADDLAEQYQKAVTTLDVNTLVETYRSKLGSAISSRDIQSLLRLYDNKGLLSIAAHRLGLKNKQALTEFVGRLLSAPHGGPLIDAVRSVLPQLE